MADSQRTKLFVQLWTAHGQRVYAYLLTLIPNRADADELFQETSVTLWEKFDEFDSGSNFRAWACRIAWNKARNFRQLRQPSTLPFGEEFFDVVDQETTRRAVTLDAQHQALADCFSRLRPVDQQLIELRYRPGATTKSVAEQVGRSAEGLYKALSRIHQTLFDCITRSTFPGKER